MGDLSDNGDNIKRDIEIPTSACKPNGIAYHSVFQSPVECPWPNLEINREVIPSPFAEIKNELQPIGTKSANRRKQMRGELKCKAMQAEVLKEPHVTVNKVRDAFQKLNA